MWHGLTYDVEQQAQLLKGLTQGVQQGLQARKVLEQLVDSEDPQHLHQPDYLAGFADYFKVLQSLKHQRSEEGDEANENGGGGAQGRMGGGGAESTRKEREKSPLCHKVRGINLVKKY